MAWGRRAWAIKLQVKVQMCKNETLNCISSSFLKGIIFSAKLAFSVGYLFFLYTIERLFFIEFYKWLQLYLLQMSSKAKSPEKAGKVKDPVSEERIFRERLHKEYVSQKINQDFQINQPEKVAFYTEKPNNNPYLLMKMLAEGKTINGVDYDEKLRDGHYKTELTSEINEKLKTVTHTPKDKWSIPQTSNQEIGWLADKRFQEGSKFVHRREGCAQTHYADSYYTMKHVSLFSNKSQK